MPAIDLATALEIVLLIVDREQESAERAAVRWLGRRAYRLTVALLPLLRRSAHPPIVNLSSGMGGPAEMSGSSPGYRVSKAALNATTRTLSAELGAEGVLVNSACPGFVKTDMGAPFGATKPSAGIVRLATLPDGGPTGGFFRDGRPIAF